MGNIEDSNKQIKLGAIMSYVSIFFSIATGLIYMPWMIQKIGQSEYGLYTLAISVIGLFTIDFGLGEAVSRFMSKYLAEVNREKSSDFLGIVFKLYTLISVLIFLVFMVVLFFSETIFTELSSVELAQFKIVFTIAAISSLVSFPFMPLNGILISYERFIYLKSIDIINRVINVVTIVLVLTLDYKLYGLVIANAFTGFISIVFKLYYIRKSSLVKINFKAKDKDLTREIFNFSIWITIIAISQKFTLNINPSILGAVSGTIEISIYAVASSFGGYVWTFAQALNGLFLPKVSRIVVNINNSTQLENLMIKVGRIQLMVVGILLVGILTMGKEFIILWVGEDFIKSYYVVLFSLATGIITLTQSIANTTLVALNKIKYSAFVSILEAAISFTISILLSKSYGAIGASIAYFIGSLIGTVIFKNIVYYKILNIDVIRFFKECHLKMIVPLILITIMGFTIQYLFPANNYILLFFKAGLVGVFYLIIMWIIAFNEYEKNLFVEIFAQIKGVLK